MKILVVCQYYYPENFQIVPICEQLAKDGFDVTVLTGLPNYPSGIVPPEYRHGHRDEQIRGVRVIRCYEHGRKRGVVHLALNYLSFCFSSLSMVRRLKEDFDLVFVYQLSPVLMALPGRAYARRHHVPLFLYCCDLWPESMKVYLKREESPLFRAVWKISRDLYWACDRIACQSSSFLPYLRRVHGLSEGKLVYLPAFADEQYLHQDFTPEGNVIDFVFLGNLGVAQNLTAVLSAVEKIRDLPGFLVHFVGDGSMLEELRQFVQTHGLEELVVFHGRHPVEEMPTFYRLADACLVSLKADNETGWTLPSKVQGYMAAGKPIIGMIDGSARTVIEESGCGICVGADDVNGLAAAMRDFVENPRAYAECGQRGRAYYQSNFSKATFIERLEQELMKLGEKHARF